MGVIRNLRILVFIIDFRSAFVNLCYGSETENNGENVNITRALIMLLLRKIEVF